MAEPEKLVAVISPWEKLSEVAKRKFRVESLPEEKKVAVWRDDLQSEEKLAQELGRIGIASVELRKQKVTARWQEIQ